MQLMIADSVRPDKMMEKNVENAMAIDASSAFCDERIFVLNSSVALAPADSLTKTKILI